MSTSEQRKETGILSGEAARLKLVELLAERSKTDLNALADKLGVLLNAQQQKVFNQEGTLLYSDKLEDNKTQLMAAKLIAQILDALPSVRQPIGLSDQAVELILNMGGKTKDAKE